MSAVLAKQVLGLDNLAGRKLGNFFESFANNGAASGSVNIDPGVATQHRIVTAGNVILNFITDVPNADPSKWASVVIEIVKGSAAHTVTLSATNSWTVTTAAGLNISPADTDPYTLVCRFTPVANVVRVTGGGSF